MVAWGVVLMVTASSGMVSAVYSCGTSSENVTASSGQQHYRCDFLVTSPS